MKALKQFSAVTLQEQLHDELLKQNTAQHNFDTNIYQEAK